MIWCVIRKRWLVQTREEVVRQLLIHFLHREKNYPMGLMQAERGITTHGVEKRFDLLCYQSATRPFLLVECKAPEIALGQDGLEQVAVYNYALQVPYLLLTNGRDSLCCAIDFVEKRFKFLDELPEWRSAESAH